MKVKVNIARIDINIKVNVSPEDFSRVFAPSIPGMDEIFSSAIREGGPKPWPLDDHPKGEGHDDPEPEHGPEPEYDDIQTKGNPPKAEPDYKEPAVEKFAEEDDEGIARNVPFVDTPETEEVAVEMDKPEDGLKPEQQAYKRRNPRF